MIYALLRTLSLASGLWAAAQTQLLMYQAITVLKHASTLS